MTTLTTLLAVVCILSTTIQALPSSRNPSRLLSNPLLCSSGRIVGGYQVDISKIPFQVSLQRDSEHFCGGSIISSTWVLTAGHCAPTSDKPELSVRVESTLNSEGGQLLAVKRSIQHPEYETHSIGVDFDFSLLELSENLELDEKLFAVNLPEQDEPVEDGLCLQVSGWGDTQRTLDSFNALRATNVPTVNQEKCIEAYASFGEVIPRMLCAGFDKGGNNACNGDSGGPLVEGSKLFGVVSWSVGCALKGYPTVYGRVAAVREWIKETSGV